MQLIFMMHPCKNMHHLTGKTVPLVIGAGGTHVCAVKEVTNMLAVDGGSPAYSTPLFRDPATNKPLSYATVNAVIEEIYQFAGLPVEQSGTHILRISGATALFSEGGSDTIIRTMGRWSSDCYRLYVRSCLQQCRSWSAKIGSASFSPTELAYDEVDEY